MKDEKSKQFILSDFYLAAFLRARNYRLIDVIKTDPRRVAFVFKDDENRANLVEDFMFGRTSIEPKNYVSAIKELKQLIHAGFDKQYEYERFRNDSKSN